MARRSKKKKKKDPRIKTVSWRKKDGRHAEMPATAAGDDVRKREREMIEQTRCCTVRGGGLLCD